MSEAATVRLIQGAYGIALAALGVASWCLAAHGGW